VVHCAGDLTVIIFFSPSNLFDNYCHWSSSVAERLEFGLDMDDVGVHDQFKKIPVRMIRYLNGWLIHMA